MKTKFHYIRRAVTELNKAKESNDLNQVTKHVNNIVTIHKEVLTLINELEKEKQWHLLQDSPDYYQLQYTIESAYHEAKNKYHSLHWDKYQYNVY